MYIKGTYTKVLNLPSAISSRDKMEVTDAYFSIKW